MVTNTMPAAFAAPVPFSMYWRGSTGESANFNGGKTLGSVEFMGEEVLAHGMDDGPFPSELNYS
jgi:hypothetical protein